MERLTYSVTEEELSPYARHDRSLLCSVGEAAEQLRIGQTNVYRLLKEGKLQSVKIGARRLIPRAALQEFVADLLEAS